LGGELFLTDHKIAVIDKLLIFLPKGGSGMPEEEVGVIVKFFAKPGVAAIKIIDGSIKKGDMLKYRGHTTDFTEEVKSMEIDNQPVDEATVGDMIGVKVVERVRENDRVYKVVD
jgi:putative protease